ncbi:MAG: FMN-binding negative transcriptional regulator [Blastocatellales bacterium]
MYVPMQFEETHVEVMHDLIRARPLATLVTLGSGGLTANHIPMEISAAPLPFGTLRCHVARANPFWRDLSADVEALAVFQGPGAYITPSWYPAKQETGKVVPTWNYAVVHAYGSLRVIDDAEWLRSQIGRLTDQNEAALPEQWKVSDAPQEFIEKLLGSIIGIEMVVTRLIGKWKVSQNRTAADQAGVISGLREHGQSDSLLMAELVEQATKTS